MGLREEFERFDRQLRRVPAANDAATSWLLNQLSGGRTALNQVQQRARPIQRLGAPVSVGADVPMAPGQDYPASALQQLLPDMPPPPSPMRRPNVAPISPSDMVPPDVVVGPNQVPTGPSRQMLADELAASGYGRSVPAQGGGLLQRFGPQRDYAMMAAPLDWQQNPQLVQAVNQFFDAHNRSIAERDRNEVERLATQVERERIRSNERIAGLKDTNNLPGAIQTDLLEATRKFAKDRSSMPLLPDGTKEDMGKYITRLMTEEQELTDEWRYRRAIGAKTSDLPQPGDYLREAAKYLRDAPEDTRAVLGLAQTNPGIAQAVNRMKEMEEGKFLQGKQPRKFSAANVATWAPFFTPPLLQYLPFRQLVEEAKDIQDRPSLSGQLERQVLPYAGEYPLF